MLTENDKALLNQKIDEIKDIINAAGSVGFIDIEVRETYGVQRIHRSESVLQRSWSYSGC